MPRPKKSGAPSAVPNRTKLTEIFIRKILPSERAFLVWDTFQRGLALQVQPTGHKAWKCIYTRGGRPRWYHLGDAAAIGLSQARTLANGVMHDVANGGDPCAVRKANRSKGTFEELASSYVDQYAKRNNRSWMQADALVRKYLLKRWAKLQATAITRADVKAAITSIKAPMLANQTLSAASALFSWAVREEIIAVNPCTRVERHATRSRERVLSDSELALYWRAFDSAGLVKSTALKTILLTGQRPGEVRFMRREHIVDGWWEMPGQPNKDLKWPGTKNGRNHRVWLPAAAQKLLVDMPQTGAIFGGVTLHHPMRSICAKLDACGETAALKTNERIRPHDLRRTHGTTITALGFGSDAMNRIQNHIEGGITSVYDRHQYSEENKKIMEAVAQRIMSLAEGGIPSAKVLNFTKQNS